MSKEAIKHYEAALKEAFPRGATGEVFHHWNEARYLIATESLDKMAENARELGLDYDVKSDHRLMEQPAQQEPVAYGMFDTMLGKGNRMMMVRLDKGQDGCTVPLYTSPPAQQEPVNEGWKLVPVEPTENMWKAVNKLDDEMAAGSYDGKGCSIEQAWNCLLDAAPQPAQRTWVGLTLEEIDIEWGLFMSGQGSGYIPDFVNAIEAKLKEKNT